MDTTQDAVQVIEPTDLHVEVVSMETLNGTGIMNGTGSIHKPDEPVDYMPILADWVQGKNLPSFKSVFVWLAIGVHVIVGFFLDYFLWKLVFTLAAVEAPQIIVPAPWTDKKSDDNDDETPRVQQERSITKSLRTTVRHLYGVGGVFAFCRGMALHVSFNITLMIMVVPAYMFWTLKNFGSEDEDPSLQSSEWTLSMRFRDTLEATAFEIASNLIFCSWLAAWVHVVMTQHTLRIWYRRLPPFMPTLRATWRPLVVLPLVEILVRGTIIILLKHSMGLYGEFDTEQGMFTSRNMLLTLFWLLAQAYRLLAVLPLQVVVVRVQASLLSEDEEPIVPFDRSFGAGGPNGLRPGLLAEPRGPLSLKQAWQSLTWAEMRRLSKTFAKMLAVQAVVNAVFWLAIGNSAWPSEWVPNRIHA